MTNTISDKIVSELLKHKIDTYFIVTGGAIVPFVDAVGRNPNVKYYCFQHEQAAAMAAEGYYKASNKIAAVLVTSGPGVQNILNGVCGCWYDSVPCMFISGQVNMNESLDSITAKPRQVGFQEFPVEETFASCTKYCKKIRSETEITQIFKSALLSMKSGRMGPVLIDFPVNLQMTCNIENISLDIDILPTYNESINIENVIQKYNRPIVVIGNGCRDRIKSVKNWIETTNIPFVTSWGGSDLIDHTHPLRIGNFGVYGDRIANYAIQNSDIVIVLGSRMDTRETGGNLSLCARDALRVMVDIDKEEIDKLNERGFKIDIPIVSSVESFVNINTSIHFDNSWTDHINNIKITLNNESIRKQGDIYDVLKKIELPDECIIIPDCGGNLVWTMQSFILKQNQKLFSNFGNSSMGYALPAAIGAAIATDRRIPILCISGDGGIQMNIQELHTVSSLYLPITILILNNAGYGIIRQFQDQYFNGRYTATSSTDVFGKDTINITAIANAYNIESHITTDCITISKNKPILYDLIMDPSQKIYPKVEFGNALENMYPYRDDIKQMMLVKPCDPIIKSGWVMK